MFVTRYDTLAALLLVVWSSGSPAEQPRTEDGQKFLGKFVGEWEVARTFYPAPGVTPIRQKGQCRQKLIHDGRFLQSDFTFGSGETTTTGKGLTGFDAESGKFTSVWTSSRSTKMYVQQSKDPFDGKQIVLCGRLLNEDKQTKTSRTVTRLEDNGRKIVHRLYITAEGAKERLVMELVLTRKRK
jgi:hypothetical protein